MSYLSQSSTTITKEHQPLLDTFDRRLFDISNNNHNDSKHRVKRIKYVSRTYAQWIHDRKKESNVRNTSIRDIINTKFGTSYNLRHFLSDYHFVINKEHLLSDETQDTHDAVCNAQSCIIIHRNSRNREYYSNNTLRRNELYFIPKQSNNTEEITRDIATQQILDSLHHFIHHTIHIDRNTFTPISENNNDDKDFDTICDDEYAQKVMKHIENIRKSSVKYKPTEQCINDKFVTSNDTDNIKRAQCESNNTKAETVSSIKCFLDQFIYEMRNSDMTDTDVTTLCMIVNEEEYDSDALILDLKDKAYSYLRNTLFDNVNSVVFGKLSNKLLVEKEVSSSVYSSGYRFFYWTCYKDNESERTVILGQSIGDYNPGYKLKDWYIPPKYTDLKNEMLNNAIKTFSLDEYNTTLHKANDKLEAWKSVDGVSLICSVGYWEEYYGIKKDEEVSIQHILALLLYTNYSKQCFELSATYRKCDEYETDLELKQRHREYHHWGKLLRECVECFGTSMEHSKLKTFYHGISSSLIFNSTTIRLCGPVSTTGKFDIAVNIFGSEGIVLEIIRRNVSQYYFDCPYWSDFASEDEKLFIGGLVHFEFNTIRDIKNKLNYWCYVQPLTMFHFMTEGWQYKKKIKKWHYKALKLLIQEEIEGKVLQGMHSVVPQYVLKLWHHFLLKIKNVEINWKYMRMDESKSRQRYGYKEFARSFVLKKWSSLDFAAFIRLLPNVETISLYNGNKNKFIASIGLSQVFTEHILNSIDIINNSSTLKVSFNEFNIVFPNDEEEIEFYIMENQDEFNDKGWELTQKTFRSRFHQGLVECPDTLCIKKFA